MYINIIYNYTMRIFDKNYTRCAKTKPADYLKTKFRQEKISNMKDPLEQLNRFIRWEDFRPVIDKAFAVTDPSLGGLLLIV